MPSVDAVTERGKITPGNSMVYGSSPAVQSTAYFAYQQTVRSAIFRGTSGHWLDMMLMTYCCLFGCLRKHAIHIDSYHTRLAVCSRLLFSYIHPCVFATNSTYNFSPTHTARHTILVMVARSQDAHRGTSHRGVLLRKISTSRVNHQFCAQHKTLRSAGSVKA